MPGEGVGWAEVPASWAGELGREDWGEVRKVGEVARYVKSRSL